MTNIARDGAPKKVTTPQPVFGHKRTTEGALHPHLHGQAQDDSVPAKSYSGKPVKIHSGMTEFQRTENFTSSTARDVLIDAKNLGRKA